MAEEGLNLEKFKLRWTWSLGGEWNNYKFVWDPPSDYWETGTLLPSISIVHENNNNACVGTIILPNAFREDMRERPYTLESLTKALQMTVWCRLYDWYFYRPRRDIHYWKFKSQETAHDFWRADRRGFDDGAPEGYRFFLHQSSRPRMHL